MSYRIQEIIRGDDSVYYQVQNKINLFWLFPIWYNPDTCYGLRPFSSDDFSQAVSYINRELEHTRKLKKIKLKRKTVKVTTLSKIYECE